MANKTDLDVRVCIDNSTGTLTDITSYLTSASIRSALDLLEDSALNDENKSYLPGKVGATIPLAGFVNSTTDTILGPYVGDRTANTTTKSIEYQAYSTGSNSTGNLGVFYQGEVLLTNVEISGSLNSIQTFSADATFDGAVTRATQSTV